MSEYKLHKEDLDRISKHIPINGYASNLSCIPLLLYCLFLVAAGLFICVVLVYAILHG